MSHLDEKYLRKQNRNINQRLLASEFFLSMGTKSLQAELKINKDSMLTITCNLADVSQTDDDKAISTFEDGIRLTSNDYFQT